MKRNFFSLNLSNFEIKSFLLLVVFSSDNGAQTSSANQIWVITWKIVGNGSWCNKIGDDRLWLESLNYCNKNAKIQFLNYSNSIYFMRNAIQIFQLQNYL